MHFSHVYEFIFFSFWIEWQYNSPSFAPIKRFHLYVSPHTHRPTKHRVPSTACPFPSGLCLFSEWGQRPTTSSHRTWVTSSVTQVITSALLTPRDGRRRGHKRVQGVSHHSGHSPLPRGAWIHCYSNIFSSEDLSPSPELPLWAHLDNILFPKHRSIKIWNQSPWKLKLQPC